MTDEGLTQSLGEKMQAVMGRYGKDRLGPDTAPSGPAATHLGTPERSSTERCPMCPRVVAVPLFENHLAMHGQAARCPICGHAGKLEEHLAHLRAESDSRWAQVEHTHGEPTAEQRVVGEAVRSVLVAELDGLELLAQRFYEKQAELAYLFGFGGGQPSEPVPWAELKARHRAWLVATVSELIREGEIRSGR